MILFSWKYTKYKSVTTILFLFFYPPLGFQPIFTENEKKNGRGVSAVPRSTKSTNAPRYQSNVFYTFDFRDQTFRADFILVWYHLPILINARSITSFWQRI